MKSIASGYDLKCKKENENMAVYAISDNATLVGGKPLGGYFLNYVCTCGYTSQEYKLKTIPDTCPNCGTKSIQKISTYSNKSFFNVYEYDFTEDMCRIKIITHDINLNYINVEDNDKTFPQIIINTNDKECVMGYFNNKYKTYIINNGNKERMLKAELKNLVHGKDCSDSEIQDALYSFSSESSEYSMADIIWGIHNKYKYCHDVIKRGLYDGYYYNIQDLKIYNNKIKNLSDEDLKELLIIMEFCYKIRNYSGTSQKKYNMQYSYDKFEYLKKHYGNKMNEYIDTYIDLNDNKHKYSRNIEEGFFGYIDDMVFLMSKGTFTLDDFKELTDLAQRQSYKLSSSYYQVLDTYKQCIKYGIPYDKKPRELAIYMDKMSKLFSMLSKFSYYKPEIHEEINVFQSKKIAKMIFDEYGFKGLDNLLFNSYMNDIHPFVAKLKDEKDLLPYVIFFTHKDSIFNTVAAYSLATKETINDKHEIIKLLTTKEEALC